MQGADELIFVVNRVFRITSTAAYAKTCLLTLQKSVLCSQSWCSGHGEEEFRLEMFTELGKVGSPPARRAIYGTDKGEQQKNVPADPET